MPKPKAIVHAVHLVRSISEIWKLKSCQGWKADPSDRKVGNKPCQPFVSSLVSFEQPIAKLALHARADEEQHVWGESPTV